MYIKIIYIKFNNQNYIFLIRINFLKKVKLTKLSLEKLCLLLILKFIAKKENYFFVKILSQIFKNNKTKFY